MSIRLSPVLFIQLVTILAALTSFSCDEGKSLIWEVRFASDSDREMAALVEHEVLEGGCETPHREVSILRSGEGLSTQRSYPAGRFGFWARAIDSNCTPVAVGCEEVSLPGPEHVVTLLLSAPGVPLCEPGRCLDGICGETPLDADIDAVEDADADEREDADDEPDADDLDADPDIDPDVDPDPDPEIPLRTCVYASGGGTETVECYRDSTECPDFPECTAHFGEDYSVGGLPNPSVITTASVVYQAHTGEFSGGEGTLYINNECTRSMPSLGSSFSEYRTNDISDCLRSGTNTIHFRRGLGDCADFVVRNVRIEAEARVTACE